MRNTFDEEVEDHAPEDCYPCHGTTFYKLPLGCLEDGRECEDEDNCYCECHDEKILLVRGIRINEDGSMEREWMRIGHKPFTGLRSILPSFREKPE